jgi:hypothetical protein
MRFEIVGEADLIVRECDRDATEPLADFVLEQASLRRRQKMI